MVQLIPNRLTEALALSWGICEYGRMNVWLTFSEITISIVGKHFQKFTGFKFFVGASLAILGETLKIFGISRKAHELLSLFVGTGG